MIAAGQTKNPLASIPRVDLSSIPRAPLPSSQPGTVFEGGSFGGAKITNIPETLKVEKAVGKTKADIEVDKQVKAQEAKLASKVSTDFNTLKNKALNLSSAFKDLKSSMPESVAGYNIGGFGQRLYGNVQKKYSGPLGIDQSVKAFDGLLNEIATALSKIASPSSRPGGEMIALFRKTLPEINSTWQEFAKQISYSIQNAEASRSAAHGELYNPIKTQSVINKILGQAMPAKEFTKFKEDAKRNIIVGDPQFFPELIKKSGIKPEPINENGDLSGKSTEELLQMLGQ